MLLSLAKSLLLLAFVWWLVAFAELAFAREAPPSRQTLLRFALFSVIFTVAATLFSLALMPRFKPQLTGLIWLVPLLLATDFLYYWMHRAQHAIPLLWRFHAVHHSIEKMGVGSGYNHLIEIPLKAALVSIPVSFFIGGNGGVVLTLAMILHGAYQHSTTRLNFGRFAWIITDNRTHRIHHSRDPEHFNRNFGDYTLLWDWLFGTARFPAKDEWPEVGLIDFPEPRTVGGYLLGYPTNR